MNTLLAAPTKVHRFTTTIDAGPVRLEAIATVGGKPVGVRYVDVQFGGPSMSSISLPALPTDGVPMNNLFMG